MDCIVHGVAKSWTRLSDFHFTLYLHLFSLVDNQNVLLFGKQAISENGVQR